MNGKHFIGAKAQTANNVYTYPPVSKVILIVDDENVYMAGTDEGTVIEKECPYATQAMADNLLAMLQGYQYQSIEADAARITPTAELGDGITVNGIYTQLAYKNIRFSTGAVVDVAAPGSVEAEHEYQQAGSTSSDTSWKLAQTYSRISKTADQILLEVGDNINDLSSSIDVQLQSITGRIDGLDGDYAEISLTLDGLTITDDEGTVKIDGGAIDADNLNVNAANITGQLTADQINTTGLQVNAANITGTLTIGQLPSSVATESEIPDRTSDLINDSGYQTLSGVTTIINDTVTTGYISALELTVDDIKLGGDMTVYRTSSSNTVGGSIGYTTSTQDYSSGIHMKASNNRSGEVVATNNGAKLLVGTSSNYYNQIYIATANAGVDFYAETIDATGFRFTSAMFYPTDQQALGGSGYYWGQIYSTNSSISTSDQNLKHDIETLPDKYITMLDNLTPKRFKFNNGTSNRYHPGFIAQDVKAAMDIAGIDSTEFGGWCKDIDVDGNEIQMLRYEEFISPMLAKIKQLEGRISMLEANA